MKNYQKYARYEKTGHVHKKRKFLKTWSIVGLLLAVIGGTSLTVAFTHQAISDQNTNQQAQAPDNQDDPLIIFR